MFSPLLTEPFAVLCHFASQSIWIRCFCLSLWLFLHIQWECCGISCGGPMQALLAVLQQWSFLDVQQWGGVHHQQTGCHRFGTSKTLSMPSTYSPTAFGYHCFKDYLLIAIKNESLNESWNKKRTKKYLLNQNHKKTFGLSDTHTSRLTN